MNKLMGRLVSYVISAVIGTFVVLRILWSFILNPKHKFWEVKSRNEIPAILQDKVYGEHAFLQLKDVKLHYVQNGSKEKELMLFIHGFPEFWFSWRHQIKEFSKDYWTVAIDMRGYGESEKKSGIDAYAMQLLVDDIKNVIQALGREKCILVAHDWGGVVGHYFIRLYPKMIKKYVLINTVHSEIMYDTIMSDKEQFFKSWYIFLMQIPYLPEFVMRIDDYAWLERMFAKISSKEELEAYKYTFRNFSQRNGPINYYRANFTPTAVSKIVVTSDELNELDVPGLYLHGNDDIAITVKAGYTKSFQGIKNVKYVNIPNADHFVQISRPDKVNQLIREFIS